MLNLMPLTPEEQNLKNLIFKSLVEQGYEVNKNIFKLKGDDREAKRNIHLSSKRDRLITHKKFILENKDLALSYLKNGSEIDVSKIDPKLILVKSDSKEEIIFKWWNLVWWSLPYEKAYGRQMRYLIWDKYNKSVIGLIGLQSPILSWSVRDDYLGIGSEKRDYWVNQSLNAQRLGALPPYNMIFGGKLISSLMTVDKVRKDFALKYRNTRSLIKKRKLPARLLFITTTGAYGKSSIYTRLKFGNENIAKFIGYSKGNGSFHIPNALYEELILYLKSKNFKVERGYGNGPSRKLRLIDNALQSLGIMNGSTHGVQRAVYLFPFINNISEVIKQNKRPKWTKRQIKDVTENWKSRWVMRRNDKLVEMRNFNKNTFIEENLRELNNFFT